MLKEINIRQRMLGAITLISLVVIFLPFILDGDGLKLIVPTPEKIEIPAETQPNIKINSVKEIKAVIAEKHRELEKETKKIAVPEKLENKTKLNLTAWAIQIATYKNEEAAKNITEKLLNKAFTAYIEKTSSKTSVLYKVKVGPFPNKKEADKLAKNIARQLKVKPLVIRYP